MRKLDYSDSINKKIVQKIVFNDIKNKKINQLVGLAGPNITDYLSFVKSFGIRTAEIYEKDYVNMLYQMRDFSPPIQTTVTYQDIYYAGVQQNTVYDLDFCCTIINAENHIKKFKDNAIITLSLRYVGLMETLKRFCKLVSRLKADIQLEVEVTQAYKLHKIIFSDKSYNCYQYRDTSPMLTISPIF